MSTIYPFDPTGKALTNKVVNELHTLNVPSAYSDFHFIIPRSAPYFRDSLKVTSVSTGLELVEGVDYVCSHRFHSATLSTGMSVFGSVTFYDRLYKDTVRLEYQTIGGDWLISTDKIVEILSNASINPRITTWEQVVNPPYQFPPIDHEFNIEDFTGAKDIVDYLKFIRDAILAKGEGGGELHFVDYSNPHRTNKTHVGLGLVQNMGLASEEDARKGVLNVGYMTPFLTKLAIESLVKSGLDSHSALRDNPHQVTAEQVGAFTKLETQELVDKKLDKTATAVDSAKVYGLDKTELFTQIAAVEVDNSKKVSGLTAEEVITETLKRKIANSERLDGMTRDEVYGDLYEKGLLGAPQKVISKVDETFDLNSPFPEIALSATWTHFGNIKKNAMDGSFTTNVSFLVSVSGNFGRTTTVIKGNISFDEAEWFMTGNPKVAYTSMLGLSDEKADCELYYRNRPTSGGGEICELWLKNRKVRGTAVVTELSKQSIEFTESSVSSYVHLDTPTGIAPFADKGSIAYDEPIRAMTENFTLFSEMLYEEL